jgi:hypothetical protein
VGQVNAQTPVPVFGVLTPKEGQTLYGNKLPILFNVENLELVEKDTSQVAQPGQGHILLWLDEENPTPENATKVIEASFIYSDVSYGNHVLKAELTKTNNSSLTPSQSITVNFKTEAIPSEAESTVTNSFDKTTAVVILVIVALVILAAWWYTKDEEDEIDGTEEKATKIKTTRTKKKRAKKPSR